MQKSDYEIFKRAIYTLTGINLSAYKERQMKRRIDSLITRFGHDNYYDFYNALRRDINIYKKFINHLTINISEFFRNPAQWERLEMDILPKLLEMNRPLKFWSSACSTGEEPYSLVMLLNKFLPFDEIRIIATDIDEEALEKAELGEYHPRSLENVPENVIEKYFMQKEGKYYIKDNVKKCVEFKKLNLIEDKYPEDCSLILCRNVMIYFTDDIKTIMYKKFHDAMHKGGILFVGSTEQIINSSEYGFRPLKYFFYIKE